MRLPLSIPLLSVALGAGLHAQDAARPVDEKKMAEVGKKVEQLIEKGTIGGAVTLVVRDGKVVQSGAYGLRDIKGGEAMTEDTIFRIYSMTKPITTAAAMILVEEKTIELDAPISRYLPALVDLKVYQKAGEPTAPARQPTVRDLMRHTSGFSYGFVGGPVARIYNEEGVIDPDSSIDAMVAKLAKIPLQDEPGTEWRYSISTDVLGAVVQAASGKMFEEFLIERIFTPLGMKDTAFYVPAEKAERLANQNGRGLLGKLKVSEPAAGSRFNEAPGLPSGGGGLCSTAGDYMRFCQMILGGGQLDGVRVLTEESVAEMSRNQLPESIEHIGIGDQRKGVGFGLGFAVRTAESTWGFGGREGELGWGGAASTHFWLLPEEGLAVVTMRNFMPYTWTLEKELKRLIYDALEAPEG